MLEPKEPKVAKPINDSPKGRPGKLLILGSILLISGVNELKVLFDTKSPLSTSKRAIPSAIVALNDVKLGVLTKKESKVDAKVIPIPVPPGELI